MQASKLQVTSEKANFAIHPFLVSSFFLSLFFKLTAINEVSYDKQNIGDRCVTRLAAQNIFLREG